MSTSDQNPKNEQQKKEDDESREIDPHGIGHPQTPADRETLATGNPTLREPAGGAGNGASRGDGSEATPDQGERTLPPEEYHGDAEPMNPPGDHGKDSA